MRAALPAGLDCRGAESGPPRVRAAHSALILHSLIVRHERQRITAKRKSYDAEYQATWKGLGHTIAPHQNRRILPRCPETIEARTITHAVDLWALGVILYQMVTLEARCAVRLVVPLRALAF